MTLGKAVQALLRREWQLTRRNHSFLYGMVLFSFLLVLVFAFVLGGDTAEEPEKTTGIFWTALLLSATWMIQQSIGKEQEQRTWLPLWLAPFPRTALYIAKSLVCTVQLLFLAALLYPVLYGLFAFRPMAWGLFLALVVSGSFGICWLGCALTPSIPQQRSAQWLSLLTYPLLIPLLLAVAKGTAATCYGDKEHLSLAWHWLQLLLLFDGMVLFFGVSMFEMLSTPENE